MKYDPLEEEKRWYVKGSSGQGGSRPLPLRHQFAHNHVRSRLREILVDLGCKGTSSILSVGCGTGEEIIHTSQVSRNVIGVDISDTALRTFNSRGFQGILADARALALRSESFDYVIASGFLHHLVGQGNLTEYLVELTRVTRWGGHVIALEPNSFNVSGLLMNVFNTIKPGITGLVPHERALSPLYVPRVFRRAGLTQVKCIAASYVWNRLPLAISKLIARHEDGIRYRKPFSLFGWFQIVYGQKAKGQGTTS